MRSNPYDVNVRVGPKVDLGGLPSESALLAVSNRNDILAVGGNNGELLQGCQLTPDVRLHTLSNIHKLLDEAAKDSKPESTPVQTLNLPGRAIWVR